jgi:hypothetical protein
MMMRSGTPLGPGEAVRGRRFGRLARGLAGAFGLDAAAFGFAAGFFFLVSSALERFFAIYSRLDDVPRKHLSLPLLRLSPGS